MPARLPSVVAGLAAGVGLVFAGTPAAAPGRPAVQGPPPLSVPDGGMRQDALPQLVAAGLNVNNFLQLQRARDDYGVDGDGLAAAILDTGVHTDHVELKPRVADKLNFTVKPNDAVVTDVSGHGTAVAGLVVGGEVGIAPGAKVIAMKVLLAKTEPQPANAQDAYDAILDALNWVLKNHAEKKISVVNVSMSDMKHHQSEADALVFDQTKAIAKAIADLRDKRVAVVVAAGNEYHRFNRKGLKLPAARPGMSFPAVVSATVSVGAVFDSNGPPIPPRPGEQPPPWKLTQCVENRICPFSQRLHPPPQNGGTDIYAPGQEMVSLGIHKNNNGVANSTNTGTSSAAPVVTGVILLMQQEYKKRTGELPKVDDLEAWLRDGGVKCIDDPHDDDDVEHTKQHYSRLNALGAMEQVSTALKRRELKDGVVPK